MGEWFTTRWYIDPLNCTPYTYTLNGNLGSDVNVILNVTFAEIVAVSVELLLILNEKSGLIQSHAITT